MELVKDLLVARRVFVMAELVADGDEQLDPLGALGPLGGDLDLEVPGDVDVACPALARGAHGETVDDFRDRYFRHGLSSARGDRGRFVVAEDPSREVVVGAGHRQRVDLER